MSGLDESRSKKHSQEKVLRAFLEHVTGSHPAVGARPRDRSPAPPASPAGEAAPSSGPAGPSGAERPKPISGAFVARRPSHPYSKSTAVPETKPEGERRPIVTPLRRSPPGSDVATAPTEIRPSPVDGVQVVGIEIDPVTPVRPAPAQAPSLGPGSILEGKYRLVKLLGRGGVGEVYEAEHVLIGLRVAVKLIRFEYAGNPELSARFLQEARAAASVGHPGIVGVHDVGTSHDGRTYLVMEYLDGEDMEKAMARQRTLPVPEVCGILAEVLEALGAAHAKGIIHRDMKPENVFLAPGVRGQRTVKLVDFGIARLADESSSRNRLTRPGSVMGTPYYMSPEQARGDENADAGVDIYAVGVMLYESLAGALPYTGNSYNEVLSKVLSQPFPSVRALRPDVPEELQRIIARATARERKDRYANATEFAAALIPFRPQRVLVTLVDGEEAGPLRKSPTGETPLPVAGHSTVPPTRLPTPEQASSRVSTPVPPPRRPPSMPPRTPGARKARRSPVLYVGGGLAAAALIVGGVVLGLQLRGGGEPSAEAAGAPAPAMQPASVRVRVLGVPPGAAVLYDGAEVGDAFAAPYSDDSHIVEVAVPGEEPRTRTVRPTTDLTLEFEDFRPPTGAAPPAVPPSGDPAGR